MANWVLTKGLRSLLAQIDAAFPGRDKASDGTIGDAAHMAESSSGHNPDDTPGSHAEYNDGDGIPEVRALDVDSDLRTPGVTMQDVVDHLRELPGLSSVLRYMIYNRRIYRASNGWASEPYDGPSAHTEHIHFSGARTQAADNNTTFNYHLEDLVAVTDAEIVKIADAVWNRQFTSPYDNTKKFAYDFLRYAVSRDTMAARLTPQLASIQAAVDADVVDEDQIIAGILAGLTPEKIAAAIPASLASAVAERLEIKVREAPADQG